LHREQEKTKFRITYGSWGRTLFCRDRGGSQKIWGGELSGAEGAWGSRKVGGKGGGKQPQG